MKIWGREDIVLKFPFITYSGENCPSLSEICPFYMKHVVQYTCKICTKKNVRKIRVKFAPDSQIKFILLLFSQTCVECYNKIVKVRTK